MLDLHSTSSYSIAVAIAWPSLALMLRNIYKKKIRAGNHARMVFWLNHNTVLHSIAIIAIGIPGIIKSSQWRTRSRSRLGRDPGSMWRKLTPYLNSLEGGYATCGQDPDASNMETIADLWGIEKGRVRSLIFWRPNGGINFTIQNSKVLYQSSLSPLLSLHQIT